MGIYSFFQFFLLAPIVVGNLYAFASVIAALLFFKRQPSIDSSQDFSQIEDSLWPSVSLLKPLCGLDKRLSENLLSCLDQDYPHYEVIFSFHTEQDPALAVAQKIKADHPNANLKIVVNPHEAGTNGKTNNLCNAYTASTGEVVVISDSDVILTKDYLKTIVGPLRNPKIGLVGTLFRAISADHFFEKLELLTFNAEHIPSVVVSRAFRLFQAILGPSYAISRKVLDSIGGFEAIAQDLVEDYRLGENVRKAGYQTILLPVLVDMRVELKNFKHWFSHQLYWNWCTRSASPAGYVFSYLMRSLPAAILLLFFQFNRWGLGVLLLTLFLRLASYTVVARFFLKEKNLFQKNMLLPLRDLLGLVLWVIAFFKSGVIWKGKRFVVRKGRLVPA